MATPDQEKWFLQFSSKTYSIPDGGGRPWGDGTAMAAREGKQDPWDTGCKVTPLIGGFETMSAIREDLRKALAYANAQSTPLGLRGHVYMANWRFNSLRDLSVGNVWKTGSWEQTQSATADETAIGLILRMLQAGIQVRILVWLPVTISEPSFFAAFQAHVQDHYYLADIVHAESVRLGVPDLGIVGLDIRVAKPLSAAHHQKTMIIRVGDTNVAYCGGVDLAFTRRDAPNPNDANPYQYDPNRFDDLSKTASQFLRGDWESGNAIPVLFIDGDKTHRWPKAPDVNYESVGKVAPFKAKQAIDLPANVYGMGDKKKPETWQTWHDQHLRLEGPIVKTLEEQYCERWVDVSRVYDLTSGYSRTNWNDNQVIFSTNQAYNDKKAIKPLAPAAGVNSVPGGTSTVQMWRTIPMRKRSKTPQPLFTRGEYTIMAGISNACRASTQMIWIFDQYFFSQPLGRLLNQRMKDQPNLYVLIVLPPFADDHHLAEHHARKLALNALTDGLTYTQPSNTLRLYNQVGVYNLWRPGSGPNGIYCHTKVQMYDRTLLVCGSANLNRRSFTNDTELDCAVLDPVLVDKHQQWLWKVLFPRVPWPSGIDFSAGDWGKKFFTKFQDAAKPENKGFLTPDPWWQGKANITSEDVSGLTYAKVDITPPTTLNGIAREQDYAEDYLDAARKLMGNPALTLSQLDVTGQAESQSSLVDSLLEPTSINTKVEENICSSDTPGKDPRAAGRLDEIVYLLEACYYQDKKGQLQWPWRKGKV